MTLTLHCANKFQVYFNLRNKVFSVKVKNKVSAHTEGFILTSWDKIKPSHINYNGQQRVREKQQKEVHAYLQGKYIETMSAKGAYERIKEYIKEGYYIHKVVYNPYKTDNFMLQKSHTMRELNNDYKYNNINKTELSAIVGFVYDGKPECYAIIKHW